MDRTRAVEKAFSKVKGEYNLHAKVQKEVAHELYNLFAPFPQGEWLEVGCGTGFLTEHLLKAHPIKIYANDLSSAMLKSLPLDPKIQLLPGNGETMDFPEGLSLIASSFSLQWFVDPAKALVRWAKKLKKGGKMIVSLPLHPSFREWEAFVGEKKVPFTLNPLLTKEGLMEHVVSEGFKFRFSLKSYPLVYSSPKAFLSWFKGIGANVSLRQERLPFSFLKELANNNDLFKTEMTVGFLEIVNA